MKIAITCKHRVDYSQKKGIYPRIIGVVENTAAPKVGRQMDKSQYLKVSYGIRRDKLRQSTQNSTGHMIGAERAVFARYSELSESLNEAERQAMLHSLQASLEKERRRSFGRKISYDPGRHIGLYLAVKALSQNVKPPA